MSIQNCFADFLEESPVDVAQLTTFSEHIPDEWIAKAVTLSDKATIRRRRLPSDMVLWLIVGMAFFRNEPIAEVARRMNVCAEGLANEELLAKSALTQARQRLGKAAPEWLFRQCSHRWGLERYPEDTWQGLQVFAVDGALFRTADTPELRDHFGSGNTSSDRQTPHPVLRVVTMMNVRSHVIVDAAISPYRRGEIPLAMPFIDSLPDNSVTLLDKGFYGAGLLLSLQNSGANRHWLLPAKKGVKYTLLDDEESDDMRVEMKVSPQARKKNPNLPETWQVRAVTYQVQGKQKTVFTSLPREQYDAGAVAALYHERWEIELGYRDIKSSMQHNALVLRSKTVELVYQELWGLLLGYNLVRREASQAAVEHGRMPNEISFKYACQFIASQLKVMSKAVSPGNTPKRLNSLRGDLSILFIDKRPKPNRPRAVKISKTRYPVNHKAAPLK
ncbi:IS4 family transposase [Shewanella indica]|nr:IS4 family transposase [Shewanella algae]MBO2672840.1 IS4 family transposase [Shewanella algae]